jgi:hypothetical protein
MQRAVVITDKRNAKGAHPAGRGVWRFSLRRGGIELVERGIGHTAYAAFFDGDEETGTPPAGAKLGWPSFGEVETELVSDTVEGAQS